MLLVIDTATEACSVALFDGQRLVAAEHDIVGRGHAEHLIPMMAALPEGGRAAQIAVGCGPGSFTGVRVGIAAARALALAWGSDIWGFSTLALIAVDAAPESGPFGVAIDGGHGELFCAQYQSKPFEEIGPLSSMVPARAAEALPDLVVGNAAQRILALRSYGTAKAAAADARNFFRLPASLERLAPSPLYGRAPDARPQAA